MIEMDSGYRGAEIRKGDPRKVALASVVKSHTRVGNEWLAQRLQMGHDHAASRLIRQGNENPEIRKPCSKFVKMLSCAE